MRASVLTIALLSLLACGDDDDDTGGTADAAVTFDAPGAPDATPADAGCAGHLTIYVNRSGGMYTKGAADDSSANVSVILEENETVTAPTYSEPDWAQLLSCVQAKFAPFNILVTDVDPGAEPHREAVLIGNPAEVQPFNQAGLAALSPSICPPIGDGYIVMVNPVAFGADLVAQCEVTAQALGITFGLDHAFSCPDLMTYLSGCGAKSFTDTAVACGEDTARLCRCDNAATQNSFQTILSIAGASCQ